MPPYNTNLHDELVYLDKTHAPLQHQEAFPLSIAGHWHLWSLGYPKIHMMLAATLTPHDFCFQSLSIHAPTCAIACNCQLQNQNLQRSVPFKFCYCFNDHLWC